MSITIQEDSNGASFHRLKNNVLIRRHAVDEADNLASHVSISVPHHGSIDPSGLLVTLNGVMSGVTFRCPRREREERMDR